MPADRQERHRVKELFADKARANGDFSEGKRMGPKTGLEKERKKLIFHKGRSQTLIKKKLPSKPKPMVKDWRFYHTTGAVWSDVHRIPKHKLHLSQRPDLDAAFKERLQDRFAEEQEAKRRDLHRRMQSIRRQRNALQRRRRLNREKADQNGKLVGKSRPRVSLSAYFRA